MKAVEMPTESTVEVANLESISMQELVSSAADVVSPVWPLKTFIAVNPLQGFEHLTFEQALLEADRQRGVSETECLGREAVNREMIKWCTTFFDEGQATIPMPGREMGFYRVFAALAPYDRRLNRSAAAKAVLVSLPDLPVEAIENSLEQLGISEEQKEEFIRQSLAALPGWAGYVKWKEQWQNPEEQVHRPATLIDYVAVRLVLTRLLWPTAGVVEPSGSARNQAFLQDLPTKEAQFREPLVRQLLSQTEVAAAKHQNRPDAQLVFCIDVRSEPFRRAVEAQGHYETFGFAGFFGLPIRVKGYDDDHAHDSCPVLLKPRHTVCEHTAAGTSSACVQRHDRGRSFLRLPKSFYQWLKYNFATPFALVEMLGPWLGLRMLARTFFPSLTAKLADKARDSVVPTVPTEPVLDSITLAQQADFGESALRLMGLTENLAPLVVLTGHGSSTTNNAYASALDCGACGGNHGGGNARTLAAILNNPAVRAALADRGLVIPGDTLFVAAEHDTTVDHVELYEPLVLTESQKQQLAKLAVDLAAARSANARTRVKTFQLSELPEAAALQETSRRSDDWAEVRPEWGLARNAAFIVGPRSLTQDVNLEGRCFLHSYDWKNDEQGKCLTTILTAPMVVAQWINSQYLFSTLDNVAYGAGSKVTHNVAGKIGVMQGNASDLMHGLPLQSVYAADDERYHEPLRLQTIVYAPRAKVDAVVNSQEVLKKLFGNGWVTLVCIDPTDRQAYRLQRDLKWQDVIE